MLVHRSKKPRYPIQIPMTSLIDIVLMLLIYFMLTTNFLADEGIRVKLPQANASAPMIQREITVCVDKTGTAYLGDQPVALHDLFKRIQQRMREMEDPLVIIKADRTVCIDKAVAVMDVVKAAGAGRLCLATEKGR